MPGVQHLFTQFANKISEIAGKPATFIVAVAGVVVWGVCGPVFGYSENWQLAINTSTTIITFLMVFILQNTQNRDGKALQTKLDELIYTSKAENSFIGVERLDETELLQLSRKLALKAEQMRGTDKPDADDDGRTESSAPKSKISKRPRNGARLR